MEFFSNNFLYSFHFSCLIFLIYPVTFLVVALTFEPDLVKESIGSSFVHFRGTQAGRRAAILLYFFSTIIFYSIESF